MTILLNYKLEVTAGTKDGGPGSDGCLLIYSSASGIVGFLWAIHGASCHF